MNVKHRFLFCILSFLFFSCEMFDSPDDGGGDSGSGGGNPIISEITLESTTVHPGDSVSLSVNATDPSGSFLNYSYAFQGGLQGHIEGEGASVTVSVNQIGEHTILVTVQNESGGSAQQSVSLTGVNQQPNISSVTASPSSLIPSEESEIRVTAVDPDSDELTYAFYSDSDLGEFSGTGNVRTYTPNEIGTHTISVEVRDPFGGYSSDSVNLTVEVEDLTLSSFSISENILSPGGEATLTAVAEGGQGNITYQFTALFGTITPGSVAGTANYTAPADGVDTISLTVSDQASGVVNDSLNITVNLPPSITGFGASLETIGLGMTSEVSVVVLDGDNSSWTYNYTASTGSVTGSTDSVIFTPDGYGDVTINVSVSDGINPPVTDSLQITVEKMWQYAGGFGAVPGDSQSLISLNDTLYVLYYYDSNDDNNYDQARLASFDGESWNLNAANAVDLGNTFGSAVMKSDGSQLYGVFCRYDMTEFQLYRSIRVFNGSQWTLVGSEQEVSSMNYIDVVKSGNDYYVSSVDTTVRVDKLSSGIWSQVGGALSTGEGYYVKIAANSSGIPYIAFTANDGGATLNTKVFSLNNSDIWESLGTEVTPGEADFLSFKIHGDVPYLGFKDDANQDRMSLMSFNGTSWTMVGTPGFPYYLSGTGDPNPLIGWTDFVFSGDDIYAGYMQSGLSGFNKGAPSISVFSGGEWSTQEKHVSQTTPMIRMDMAIHSDGVLYFIANADSGDTSTMYRFQ